MKSLLAIISMMMLALIQASSVIAQKQTSAAESRALDMSSGYSFAVPAGWIKEEGNGGFAMINPAQTIIVVVKAHNYKDFNSFFANFDLAGEGMEQIGETQDLDGGVRLIRAAKQTEEGILVVDTLVLFSPHGGGVAIAAFTDQKNSKAALQTAVGVAQSLRFDKPRKSAVSSHWQNYLKGKHLIYLNTSRSFSDRIDIYLCPTGRFYVKGNTAGISRGGGGTITMAEGSNNSGTWRAVSRGGDRLILQFESGAISELTLERRQSTGEISLDGSRYFVKSDANCQ